MQARESPTGALSACVLSRFDFVGGFGVGCGRRWNKLLARGLQTRLWKRSEEGRHPDAFGGGR